MFGDLLNDMQHKQEALKEKLRAIDVNVEKDGISIEANAAKEIKNVTIDDRLLNSGSHEELEDLLVIAINEVFDRIVEVESAESQKMVSEMLPPGLGGLFGG